MNRKQEHFDLKQEIFSSPAALDSVLANAQTRAHKRSVRNRVITPLGTFVAMFVLFAGLVNFSPTVAAAVERIPGLRQLAEFVSFSPSLSAAVEHEFIQPLGLEQIIGDEVTMRVEYVIADGRQVHIFYTLESMDGTNLDLSFTGRGADNVEVAECCINHRIPRECCITNEVYVRLIIALGDHFESENGRMGVITFGFDEAPVPPFVIWDGEVFEMTRGHDTREPRNRFIGRYGFVIEIDEAFTGQYIYEVNQDFVIEDQRFTITSVELSPAHTRINIETDWVNNTQQLQRLVFYMINEHGVRFDPPHPRTGLVNMPAGGYYYEDDIDDAIWMGPWRIEDHFLETAFFTESESLTLVITGVEWNGMQWFGPHPILLDEPIEITVK